ncbi:MAG TPA: hypothetical protein VFT87_03585 [Candidatus Saccharimonadales bacterium]|nr:hypothetical protein [Candidatus Saccharimonadales bacterium]
MRRFIIFIAVVVAMTIPVPAVFASPESVVSERCGSVKIALDQQRRRDLVTRINRGRAYQTIIDQLQALTDRVRNNQMAVQPFEQQVAVLKQDFELFRTSYTAYDDGLRTLLNIDCKDKPGEFLAQLIQVRQLRTQIGEREKAISDTLGRFREIMVNLQHELERLRNAVLGEQQ